MPLVTIDSCEKEQRMSKAGKRYDCVVFYGTKHGYEDAPDEPWEKAMVPWADGEWINEIKSYDFPAKLLIKNEKVGKNWRIVSIQPWGDTQKRDGSGTPSNPEQPSVPANPGMPQYPQVPVTPTGVISNDEKMIRCLEVSGNIVKGMLNNAETFKNMIKKSANPALITQMVKDIANEFYRLDFNNSNPFKDKPQSNNSSVDPESDDPDEIEVPMD